MTEALFNHLWQSTLFAIAAALLTLAFRRNGAKVRFLIWLAASVKFLIPFSLFIWIGRQLRGELAPAVSPSADVSILIDQIAQPGSLVANNFATLPLARAATGADWNVPMVLLSIWALGALLLLGRRLFQWLYLLAISKASSPIELNTPIPARETRSTLEPGLFGIFSPTLLLPAGITAHLTQAQLDAIVAHELCHWRRRDNLFAALHMLVEALFWFHPLVWWLGSRLVAERERACDEAVVQSGNERHVYAEGILRICQRYLETPKCSAGVSGGTLRKRIEDIMTHPVRGTLPLTKKCLLAGAALVAVAGPLGVGIGSAGIARAADATAMPMKHYKSDQWSFELDVPRRWVVMPAVPTNSPYEVIRFMSRENGHHNLIVFRNPHDPRMSMSEIVDRTEAVLANAGFSSFIRGESVVGGKRVPTLDFSRATPDGNIWYCRHYFVAEGTVGYVLGFGSTNRDEMFELYDRMARSFAFQAL